MQRSLPLPAAWGSGGAVGPQGKTSEEVQGSEPTEASKIQEFLEVKMGYNGNRTQ